MLEDSINEARSLDAAARRDAFCPEAWSALAAVVGHAPSAPVVVALSGGADSVYLLHVVAAARPRPRVLAVHVDHGLRGAESDRDRESCRILCADLDVEFQGERIELDPRANGLEGRARTARYRALCRAAERASIDVILTAHHADDVHETLLQRWMRGGELAAFAGVPARTELRPSPSRDTASALNPTGLAIALVRPLLRIPRALLRAELVRRGIAWREDASNADMRFTRNRVRHGVAPILRAACGDEALDRLTDLSRAVQEFEARCREHTAHIAWRSPSRGLAPRSPAGRDGREFGPGGRMSWPEFARFAALAEPLRRFALRRLIVESTGRAPTARQIERILVDVGEVLDRGLVRPAARAAEAGAAAAAPARGVGARAHELAGGFRLVLGRTGLRVDPPRGRGVKRAISSGAEAEPVLRRLALPGSVELTDGRTLQAEILESRPTCEPPRAADVVELDAYGIGETLFVRGPRAGDRFRALGAPGTRALSRFLRDAGVPLEERGRVALVCAGTEIVWVAGIRPAEARRVTARTSRRLRLSLRAGPPDPRATSGSS